MAEQDLAGRVALVTGASSGMGLAAARARARRGARVAIASRGGEKLEAARAGLAGEGAEVMALAADVRDGEALAAAVVEAERRLGPVEVLVANGGGPPAKLAAELTDADWEA